LVKDVPPYKWRSLAFARYVGLIKTLFLEHPPPFNITMKFRSPLLAAFYPNQISVPFCRIKGVKTHCSKAKLD